MLYAENIILYCLKQINGERTIYSIYHLFNGKKSSQTIQDAHLFSIKRYFRLFEALPRESFNEMIDFLHQKGLIYPLDDQRYLLTESGEQELAEGNLPSYINGWDYHPFTSTFWERLSLFIQVISNFAYQETKYIPIQKDKQIHSWLKSVLKDIKIPRDQIAKSLYEELISCLEEAGNRNPAVLVFRLTGFRRIGLTSSQAAKLFNMNPVDYHIEFTNLLHYLFQRIEQVGNRFYLLSFLLKDIKEKDSLTVSTRKTHDLLRQGYSKERIAQIRNLKVSTIEDHIVEIALNVKDFQINAYVEHEMQNKIMEISRREATRQLKQIRNKLNTVSYFQIRLVLAKNGEG